MKTVKQLLFAAAVTICLSVSASAQKEGDKNNTPPKPKDPPVVIVTPKDKKPKDEKPKDDKKKPQAIIFYFRDEAIFG